MRILLLSRMMITFSHIQRSTKNLYDQAGKLVTIDLELIFLKVRDLDIACNNVSSISPHFKNLPVSLEVTMRRNPALARAPYQILGRAVLNQHFCDMSAKKVEEARTILNP